MKKTRFAPRIKSILVLLLSVAGAGLQAQEVVPPRCYGGNRLTSEFVQEEMIYPAPALEAKKEGTVVLAFLVMADGSVRDLQVEQRVSPELDREAIRIFRKILWHPATNLGVPVNYPHRFEVRFSIRKYMKLIKSRGPEYFAYPFGHVDSSLVVYARKDVDQPPKPCFSILDNNFQTFLSNNLDYPDAAFKLNISGTVELRFVVEASGRVSNIEAVKHVGGGCTEEAIRVLKLIKWFPGIKDGLAVRTGMPLEITFDIANRSVGGTIPSPGQVR